MVAVIRTAYPVTTFLFFFQAEDGIRDDLVTGVQTCALPIFWSDEFEISRVWSSRSDRCRFQTRRTRRGRFRFQPNPRSEERRVGKEYRCAWPPHEAI